jgi:hypothetical protein
MKEKIYYLGGSLLLKNLNDLYLLFKEIFPDIQIKIKSVVDELKYKDKNILLQVSAPSFTNTCEFYFVYYNDEKKFMDYVFKIKGLLDKGNILYYIDYFERDGKGNVISEEISLIHKDWFNAPLAMDIQ